jgi:hypothetical protein
MKKNLVEMNSLYMRLEADQFIDFASFDSHNNLKQCIFRAIEHYKRDRKAQ